MSTNAKTQTAKASQPTKQQPFLSLFKKIPRNSTVIVTFQKWKQPKIMLLPRPVFYITLKKKKNKQKTEHIIHIHNSLIYKSTLIWQPNPSIHYLHLNLLLF